MVNLNQQSFGFQHVTRYGRMQAPALGFLRNPLAIFVAICILGLFLGGISDISWLFLPYRWWFVAGLALGMLGMLFRISRIPYRPEHRALFAFMAVSTVSCIASPMPEYSFARLFSFIVMFIGVFLGVWVWLQKSENLEMLVTIYLVTAITGAVWSAADIFQTASFIPETRFTGAFEKATGTGSFAAASLPVVLWRTRYSKGRWKIFFLFILFVLFYMLVFSGARAAIIGGLTATLVWLWKHWKNWRVFLAGLLITFSTLVLCGALTLDVLPSYIVREHSLSTFTGRIPRWNLGLSLFAESPVIGHGYGMTRYIQMYEEDEQLKGIIVPDRVTFLDAIPGFGKKWLGRMTLHSDHVERLLEGGIFAYICFACFWFFLIRRLFQVLFLTPDLRTSLAIALGLNVSYIFIDSFMHGALFAINAPGTLLAWVAIVLFMAASDRVLKNQMITCASSMSSTVLIRVREVQATPCAVSCRLR
ncbi:MAG: O-antigen ligase family protein [Candidatus Methanomethylicaceae archaeon]